MPRFDITVTDTVATSFKLDAESVAEAEAVADEMATERSFPALARERPGREITVNAAVERSSPRMPDNRSPELVARLERIEAAKRMKPEALSEFILIVEATVAGLEKQPFHVQVACGLDALTAELVILRGEG